MVSKFKKRNILGLIVSAFVIFSTYTVLASDSDTKDMGNRIITDTNKVWFVGFKSQADIASLSNNVELRDLTSGDVTSPNVSAADNNNYVVKISAPAGGYVIGHKYKLTLKNGIKSKVGKALPKAVVVTFSVISKDSNYTASANVMVSPYFPSMKQITLSSTSLPDAQKYRIEGNDKLFDIGSTARSIVGGDNVKIYICDSLGNVLATTNMNVSTTNSNMNLNLSF